MPCKLKLIKKNDLGKYRLERILESNRYNRCSLSFGQLLLLIAVQYNIHCLVLVYLSIY